MSLTCISCKLLFSVPQLHQEHYKTDWHRYNLKRRLAELPSLTKEEFDKRAAVFKESAEDKFQKESLQCKCCNKHFSSKNAMVNHLKSKKHLEIESGEASISKKMNTHPKIADKPMVMELDIPEEEWADDDGDWESCDESDEEDGEKSKRVIVDTNDCLFCGYQSDSTENNVTHMTEAHSFFIPDIEYLVDLDGLIVSLAAKIHLDHICLWCNGKGKGFQSVKSVMRHMIDKGHTKMLHEGEALFDYADFYDYTAVDETKESDMSVIDELLDDSNDYELVLPSGATVGHRSLAIYYKQNLKPISLDSRQKVKKLLQHYKALGYIGATRSVSITQARDISYMQRIKGRYNLKLGLKHNKFQPHFRQQVMF